MLIGYGDIGQRLTSLLHLQGFAVVGARRRPEQLPDAQNAGAQAEVIRADATRLGDWQSLISLKPDVIVMTFTPPEYSDAGYEQGYVQPVRAFLAAAEQAEEDFNPLIFFVSSTTVYGERKGEWVDETTPERPTGFAGTRMLEAESMLTESRFNACILRCSGIYGPGRERMRNSLKKGTYTITPAWTNRVHVDDVTGAITHLINRAEEGMPLAAVYLITDNEPLLQEDVVSRYGYDPSDFPHTNEIGPRGSKRLSNQRICSTGYSFRKLNP